MGQRVIAGEHLYAHFCKADHEGMKDISVKIIDRTSLEDPTRREGFWAYKLDSFIPNGLNLRDFTY